MPLVMLWQQSDYMLGFPVSVDNQAQLFVAPRSQLGQAKVDWRKIVDREDSVRWFDVHGNDLIVMTSTSPNRRSEEHTSELQPLMRISYAVFCLKKKKQKKNSTTKQTRHI